MAQAEQSGSWRSSGLFSSIFGKETAIDEIGSRFEVLQKTSLKQQDEDLAALVDDSEKRLGEVQDKLDDITNAIEMQQDLLDELKHNKSAPNYSASIKDAKERLSQLKKYLRQWSSEYKLLLLEKYLPGKQSRWLVRAQAEDDVFIGMRDLRLDNFGARFDVRAGAGWLMLELSDGRVGISLEQLSIRGSSASARLLSAFLSPEAVEFSMRIRKLVLPCVWQKIPDEQLEEGMPTHRWHVDDANMSVEITFEKSIKGAASAPDKLLNWVSNRWIPELMRHISAVLPDELGELLGQGSLHWLCAGQLSLETTISRSIWTSPLASRTNPESKVARDLLGIDRCLERMIVFNDWCEKSGHSDFVAPLSLRSLHVFFMKYGEDESNWLALLTLLQEVLELWEMDAMHGGPNANSKKLTSVSGNATSARTGRSASISAPASSFSSTASASSSGASTSVSSVTVELDSNKSARRSHSRLAAKAPKTKPDPAAPSSGMGFFGALFYSCCASSLQQDDASDDDDEGDEGCENDQPPGRVSSSESSSSYVSSLSSSSPSKSSGSGTWLEPAIRRVVEIARKHMQLKLDLSRFDLQLDLTGLLDIGIKIANRLAAVATNGSTLTMLPNGQLATVAMASPGSSSPQAAVNAASIAVPLSQLLLDLPRLARGVLRQVDHAQSTFNLEVLGGSDCHLDVTFDNVSLQARAPVAHFLMDPTESQVSAAMPGMEIDVKYTPEGLVHMSWHFPEREDLPKKYKTASMIKFPSMLSTSFVLGGVQLLMFPCKLKGQRSVNHNAPANNAMLIRRKGENGPSSSAAASAARIVDTFSTPLLKNLAKGTLSLNVARVGAAVPVWLVVSNQWSRFFAGMDDEKKEDDEDEDLQTKEMVAKAKKRSKKQEQAAAAAAASSKSSGPSLFTSSAEKRSRIESMLSVLAKSSYQTPAQRPPPKTVRSVFSPILLDPRHEFLIQSTLDFSLLVQHSTPPEEPKSPSAAASASSSSSSVSSLSSKKPSSPSIQRSSGKSSKKEAFPFASEKSQKAIVSSSSSSSSADESLVEDSASLCLSTLNEDEFFEIKFVFHMQDLFVDLQNIVEEF